MAGTGQQLFQRQTLQRRAVPEQTVQIVDVGLQMPVVMQVHGFFVNERLQRVIGIGAGGCAVLLAHFARDVAVLVVAVAKRDLTCAAGGLREQIAYAVVAVYRCQGARRGFNPLACRVVGVAGHVSCSRSIFYFFVYSLKFAQSILK